MERNEHSSKGRLLAAAKTLFAEKGYQATAISDITRTAKTSHSQFLKYFSGKEQLRTEIIEQQWSELTKAIVLATSSVQSRRQRLELALNMFVSSLEKDSEFRSILLLEQAAERSNHSPVTSIQFRGFSNLLLELVNAVKAESELMIEIDTSALRSALIGAVEGMMRDQLLASPEFPAQYSVQEVRQLISIIAGAAYRVHRPTRQMRIPITSQTTAAKSIEDEWIHYYLRLGDTALNPAELS